LFKNYSSGVKTQRDAWAYNSSKALLGKNMKNMIDFYNNEVDRYIDAKTPPNTDDFIDWDNKRISWTRALKWDLEKLKRITFTETASRQGIYRPFQKQWLYFDRRTNEMVYQIPRLFPDASAENLVIQVSGIGARAGFSALMSNVIPNLHTVDSGQCFPLYQYEESKPDTDLFSSTKDQASGLTRRDAITDEGLAHFKSAYPNEKINKEDLFYYIYGLLHSAEYRERFANNLAKQLPRIPAVKTFTDFVAFRDAGRALGDLHVNFETVTPYMVTFKEGDHRLIPEAESNP